MLGMLRGEEEVGLDPALRSSLSETSLVYSSDGEAPPTLTGLRQVTGSESDGGGGSAVASPAGTSLEAGALDAVRAMKWASEAGAPPVAGTGQADGAGEQSAAGIAPGAPPAMPADPAQPGPQLLTPSLPTHVEAVGDEAAQCVLTAAAPPPPEAAAAPQPPAPAVRAAAPPARGKAAAAAADSQRGTSERVGRGAGWLGGASALYRRAHRRSASPESPGATSLASFDRLIGEHANAVHHVRLSAPPKPPAPSWLNSMKPAAAKAAGLEGVAGGAAAAAGAAAQPRMLQRSVSDNSVLTSGLAELRGLGAGADEVALRGRSFDGALGQDGGGGEGVMRSSSSSGGLLGRGVGGGAVDAPPPRYAAPGSGRNGSVLADGSSAGGSWEGSSVLGSVYVLEDYITPSPSLDDLTPGWVQPPEAGGFDTDFDDPAALMGRVVAYPPGGPQRWGAAAALDGQAAATGGVGASAAGAADGGAGTPGRPSGGISSFPVLGTLRRLATLGSKRGTNAPSSSGGVVGGGAGAPPRPVSAAGPSAQHVLLRSTSASLLDGVLSMQREVNELGLTAPVAAAWGGGDSVGAMEVERERLWVEYNRQAMWLGVCVVALA
jgi:hypothetical protein